MQSRQGRLDADECLVLPQPSSSHAASKFALTNEQMKGEESQFTATTEMRAEGESMHENLSLLMGDW